MTSVFISSNAISVTSFVQPTSPNARAAPSPPALLSSLLAPHRGARVLGARHRASMAGVRGFISSKFKPVAREPALVNPGRALTCARARPSRFRAREVVFARRRVVFASRSARPRVLRAKHRLYQEFSGTYQNCLVQDCLPTQNGWYAGTWYKKGLYQALHP